jgi:hypothetical protein
VAPHPAQAPLKHGSACTRPGWEPVTCLGQRGPALTADLVCSRYDIPGLTYQAPIAALPSVCLWLPARARTVMPGRALATAATGHSENGKNRTLRRLASRRAMQGGAGNMEGPGGIASDIWADVDPNEPLWY